MKKRHLSSFDLNLLVSFVALFEERQVTRAAARLGLTQSAMSHVLARLRAAFDEPLFTSTRGGLLPTARAEQLVDPVRRALADLDAAVTTTAVFDPATARRPFTIITSDYGLLVLLPTLAKRVAALAPGCDLVVRAPAPGNEIEQLERGSVDLVLGAVSPGPGQLLKRSLFEERFVCLLRAGHRFASERWSVADYAALSHVLISPTGAGTTWVDPVLAARGMRRRVAVTVPHYLVAPLVVAATDHVLTIPERAAHAWLNALPITLRDPPMAIPGFTFWAFWHARRRGDPAHRWLRQQVIAAARGSFAG